MKAILSRLLIFSFPIIAIIALLFILPYNRSFAYLNKNNQDCNTSWIYHRIFENKTNIDIAFMGTSHTGCGINDQLIEDSIQSNLNTTLNVTNIAYCGGGRNLDIVVLKDLIQNKKPKVVFIELRNENDALHKDYGIIAPTIDLLFPPDFSEKYFSNLYDGIRSRWSQLRDEYIFGPKLEINALQPIAEQLHLNKIPNDFAIYQKKKKIILSNNNSQKHSFLEVFKDTIKTEKAITYAQEGIKTNFSDEKCMLKIVELLKKNNIAYYFIYIPSYEKYAENEIKKSPYAEMGTILFPPEIIFKNSNLWIDTEHLNLAGATKLSKWVSQEVQKNIPLLH